MGALSSQNMHPAILMGSGQILIIRVDDLQKDKNKIEWDDSYLLSLHLRVGYQVLACNGIASIILAACEYDRSYMSTKNSWKMKNSRSIRIEILASIDQMRTYENMYIDLCERMISSRIPLDEMVSYLCQSLSAMTSPINKDDHQIQEDGQYANTIQP